ncbi:hypothetical protein EYF80_003846 [Liparis tanakae]|uniref:Uncharacterized protein n=1 Tax=Liparis tanakae TaxID=230148 RepID=A0A4Z2J979_9TELE|nr:hypothetical protein EYF80_003846 [Liparis tanakae]
MAGPGWQRLLRERGGRERRAGENKLLSNFNSELRGAREEEQKKKKLRHKRLRGCDECELGRALQHDALLRFTRTPPNSTSVSSDKLYASICFFVPLTFGASQ